MTPSTSHRAVLVLLAAGCFAIAAVPAQAGYGEAAPAGVVLAGTAWQLVAQRSDDPRAALQKAREELEARWRKAMSERSRRTRGRPPFDGGDEYGTYVPDRPGNPEAIETRDRDRGRDGHAAADGPGAPAEVGLLDELARHPTRLAFAGARGTMPIDADGFGTECEAGNDTMLQDGFGYGSRRCGWEGRAWIVETRHERGARRIDRYEISRDGRLLTYSTLLAVKGLSKVLLTRTYEPAAPVSAAAPAAAARPPGQGAPAP